MKNHTYNQILATVFFAGPVSPKAMFFGSTAYERNVRKLLQRAIANGHLKEYEYTERYGVHWRDYPYLTITAAGLYYLSECDNFTWAKCIPDNIKRVSVFDSPLPASSVAY